MVCDIGCGRGTTTLRLATELTPARLIALDQSQALLDTVQDRLAHAEHAVETVRADFHHLPLREASIDVAVAAFCQAVPVEGLPVAFYKDADIRNFLLTADGIAIVDFDDLTLAPFGYDLAKLVVSTAMTYGHLDPSEVEEALEVYNTHTTPAGRDTTTCSVARLRVYAEFHHLLTARYLHRNGYTHAWPEVRPWREPEVSQPNALIQPAAARRSTVA